MDKKTMLDLLLPPQAGMLLKGASLLQGCSGQSPIDVEEELLFREGDNVCLIVGDKKIRYTLLEDIKDEQTSAFAEDSSGKRTMIAVANIRDLGTCHE